MHKLFRRFWSSLLFTQITTYLASRIDNWSRKCKQNSQKGLDWYLIWKTVYEASLLDFGLRVCDRYSRNNLCGKHFAWFLNFLTIALMYISSRYTSRLQILYQKNTSQFCFSTDPWMWRVKIWPLIFQSHFNLFWWLYFGVTSFQLFKADLLGETKKCNRYLEPN